MESRFVAFDVETANEDFSSICAIGAVCFDDQGETSTLYSLVDPEESFSGFNIHIHGITPDDVVGAPTFADIAPRLRELLDDAIVVTHTAFDRAAVQQAHSRHALSAPRCRWLDTARVVRRSWPDEFARTGYVLRNVADWCGIEFRHHSALEDARAAGLVLRQAIADTGFSLEEWLASCRRRIDGIGHSGGAFRMGTERDRYSESVRASREPSQ